MTTRNPMLAEESMKPGRLAGIAQATLSGIVGLAFMSAVGIGTALAGTIQITDTAADKEAQGDDVDLFMKITNTGDVADRLYAVRTNVAEEVHLSATGEEEEIRIEAATGEIVHATTFEIGPGETLVLSGEGPHIELGEVNDAVAAGQKFKVTLFFEKAGRITLDFVAEGD